MSNSIFINGKTYHKISQVAEHFGYSADYVTQLARAKKILAVQLNRRWYVAAESLSGYVEIRRIEQNVRQAQLRRERQQEIAVHDAVASVGMTQELLATRTHMISFLASLGILTLSVWVGVLLLAEESAVPLLLTASAPLASQEVSASDELVLTPVFDSDKEVVLIDHDRGVARPDVNDNWLFISYD